MSTPCNTERKPQRLSIGLVILSAALLHIDITTAETPNGPTHDTGGGVRRLRRPPHLILVIGDDVGYNNVGYHGGNPEAQTPVIDSLASEGVTFSRFYAYCWCGPSRASLLSGRFPHRIYQNNQLLTQPDAGLPLGILIQYRSVFKTLAMIPTKQESGTCTN